MTDHSEDFSGRQFGNYRLLRLLGQGGFADVYLGQHIHLNTQAAIKVLRMRLARENMESFRREAQTIARLEHPNIVRILDFGIERDIPYLVMTYAPYGSLRKRYPKGTRLPLASIIDNVRQIASALQYAHNQHLVHRDVKPDNILLGKNFELLLSDFGIAMIAQTSHQSHAPSDVTGTAPYMAPEQIQGRPGPASDQYALAIMTYEWLTGHPPFQGSLAEIYAQHLTAPLPPLHQGLSQGIIAALHRALAKDPQHRFPSIEAFAQALQQASERTSLSTPTARASSPQITPLAPPPPPPVETAVQETHPQERSFSTGQPLYTPHSNITYPQTSPHPPRKKRGVLYALVAALLLVAIVGAGALWMVRAMSSPPPKVVVSPTPTKPKPGDVLYQAHWKKEATQWNIQGQWQAIDDATLKSSGESENSFVLYAPYKPTTSDYAVEAQIKYQGPKDILGFLLTDFGIVVQAKNGDGMAAGFDYISNLYITGMKGGRLNTSMLQEQDYDLEHDVFHTYRVEVKGARILFFLDGKKMLEVTEQNAPQTPGQIGLRSRNAVITVTSFKVLAL